MDAANVATTSAIALLSLAVTGIFRLMFTVYRRLAQVEKALERCERRSAIVTAALVENGLKIPTAYWEDT